MVWKNFARNLAVCVALLPAVSLAGPKQMSCQVSGCSGTLVSKGRMHAFGISAAHCAEVGKTVSFRTSDGRTGRATWVAVDTSLDLALFRIETGLCLETANVGPAGPTCEAHGLNGHKILKRKRKGVIYEKGTKREYTRDEYSVEKGKFDNGDSGGGVFFEGKLCGVISHGDDDEELFSATCDQILGFLADQKELVVKALPKGLNGWGDKDRTREIIELKKRVAALEDRLSAAVPGPPGVPGAAGPPGPPGPAGSNGSSADLSPVQARLATIEKWITNFRATIRVRVLQRKEPEDGINR